MSAPECVQLDGLVILKIMKHAREALPDSISGQLLGLDVQGRLEVTGSFPMPPTTTTPIVNTRHYNKNAAVEVDDGEAARDDMEYQLQMMKLLREVNIDSNSVGWYQSVSNADLLQVCVKNMNEFSGI
jgi:translation initiation factor 3 subunit H